MISATTMPLERAAAVAELHVGTEVRPEGRRAAVQRRSAVKPKRAVKARLRKAKTGAA